MKSLQLGINYGMSVKSLAKSLNIHALIASAIIERHKAVYAPFWKWRAEDWNGRCRSGASSPCLVGRCT